MLETIMALALTSTAFGHHGPIPKAHTCQGQDVSVPLAWSGLPSGTRSLALIVDDPDAPDRAAPRRTWVHWVLYNIPSEATGLKQAVKPAALPPGTLQGKNDWGRTGYAGPCPPIGARSRSRSRSRIHTSVPAPALVTAQSEGRSRIRSAARSRPRSRAVQVHAR